MPETMWRWELSVLGRANLKLVEVPVPVPSPGELLVKVGAVALNFRDGDMIANGIGGTLPWPFTPASDMAGTVVAVGEGITRFQPGDRVISLFEPDWTEGAPPGNGRAPFYKPLGGYYPGVLSQFLALPEHWFTAAPASLDDAAASTLPCAGLTAWFALVERGRLRAGETVLVHGTGGVALFGAQIAKAHGAEVIVVSGSANKLERAKALGIADHSIDRGAGDWVEAVWRVTGDRGADHILEIVGGAHLGRSLQAVATGGRISMIGVLEGGQVSGPVGPLLLKNPTIQGIAVGHRRAQEDLVRAVDHLGLKPVIDAQYRVADLPAALDHFARGAFGKIVLDPSH